KEVCRDLKNSEFSVLVGSPAILTQGLDAGCAGAVLAVGALAPNTACAIERAYSHNNFERAEDLQKRLAGLARVTAASGVGHLKAAMDVIGLYGYLPRSPMPVPPEDERAGIEKAIEEGELVERRKDGRWGEGRVGKERRREVERGGTGHCASTQRLKSIEDRGSRIEDRGSRIEDRGSRIEDRGSRIEDRRSKIEDRRSKIEDRRSKIEDR